MSQKPRKPKNKRRGRGSSEPGRIELSREEKKSLADRLEARELKESDYKLLLDMLKAMDWMGQMLTRKALSVRRLMRVFGFSSEKADKVFPDKAGEGDAAVSPKRDDGEPTKTDEDDPPPPNTSEGGPKPKPRGHGKSSAEDFPGAKRVMHEHEELSAGTRCPECHAGNLREIDPGRVVKFYGQPPLEAKVHETQKFRCNTCGEIFEAKLPKEVPKARSTPEANALICLLRYMGGFPHYRLGKFQNSFGTPLPPSTQWGMVERAAKPAYRIFGRLLQHAAQCELYHNDDTGMRIQDLKKELVNTKAERRGIYTTGIIAKDEQREMALFFTGNRHAGENLSSVLKHRSANSDTPLQMCDALSRNPAKDFATILGFCMDHARRGFVDVAKDFPEECRHFIEQIGQVYGFDKTARKFNMDKDERLNLHKTYSLPIMEGLRDWGEKLLGDKEIEPNSGLGDAINYFLNHWQELTTFCRHAGVPLSNAAVERLLKTAITHRKNSLHYKTETGALIGDVMMSLIQTCVRVQVNPFHYLVAIQRHAKQVFKDPDRWLPWNYEAALA